MKAKPGFLRRVALLAAFAWAYERFVFGPDGFVPDPAQQSVLRLLLYGATAWAVLTLAADRAKDGALQDKEADHDE